MGWKFQIPEKQGGVEEFSCMGARVFTEAQRKKKKKRGKFLFPQNFMLGKGLLLSKHF